MLVTIEKLSLTVHIISLALGVVGLAIFIPHPELLGSTGAFGLKVFSFGMGYGSIAFMISGALAISAYAIRVYGYRDWLVFFLTSFILSLSSELIGTSTGFPFGEYQYLSGLGYKFFALVPFTIPLSWFYLGFSALILLRAYFPRSITKQQLIFCSAGAALLLLAWDLVLDPAMTQTPQPFWVFGEEADFFGMPLMNLFGWFLTGFVYCLLACLLSKESDAYYQTKRYALTPLLIFVINWLFGAVIVLAVLPSQFIIPVLMSVGLIVLVILAARKYGALASSAGARSN